MATVGLHRNLESIHKISLRAGLSSGSPDPAIRALATFISDLARHTEEALREIARTAEQAEADAHRARRFTR